MCDKIEEKIPLYVKLMSIPIICSLLFWIIYYFNSLLKSGFNGSLIIIGIIVVLSVFPVSILTVIILRRSVSKITIEDSTFTAKLIFRKPIIVPLKNISKVEIWGNYETNKHWYIIKFNNENIKSINTFLLCFRMDRDFDAFIEKLKLKIDKAKQDIL